jgi:peptidoglycan hydrolase CwlO-like protein
MDLWEKVKRDVQKGVREGIAVIKEKAEELGEEGKKRIRLFELKTKIQSEFTELGGKVYSLSAKVKNPMLDKKVKAITNRIKKLEAEIAKLEGKQKAAPKKKTVKK